MANIDIQRIQKRLTDFYPLYTIVDYEIPFDGNSMMTLKCNIHNANFLILAKYIVRREDIMSKNLCPLCIKEDSKYSLDEFLEFVKIKYKDRYIFDENTIYTGCTNNVIVKCPKHGYFEVNAHILLLNTKPTEICPECKKTCFKLTTEEFLEKVPDNIKKKYIFDDKFVYNGIKEPVIIKCPKHGYFETTPKLIMMGIDNLCKECQKELKLFIETEELFIQKATEIYGDKYSFDNCGFVNMLYPVRVYCNKHKQYFEAVPSLIIRNNTVDLCPTCLLEKTSSVKKFFKTVNKKWSDKYTILFDSFVDFSTPMKLVCSKHGLFEVMPWILVNRDTIDICPECMKDGEWFRIKATKRFGKMYMFDEKCIYKSLYEPVLVKCPKHGYFEALPIDILYIRNNKILCETCMLEVYENRGHKITKQLFILKCKEKFPNSSIDFDKIKNYKNMNSDVTMYCNIHGWFTVNVKNFYYNHNGLCPLCIKDKTSQEYKERDYQLYKEFIEQLKIKQPLIDISTVTGPYYRTKNRAIRDVQYDIVCKEHGIQRALGYYILKHGCPKCEEGGHVKRKEYTPEEFYNEVVKIYGNEYDLSELNYIDYYTPVTLICKKHGKFLKTPELIIYNHNGCPICKNSKLEKYIVDFLQNNDIAYIPQANYSTFNWLGRKSLDFYLPDYNVAIECQGAQHYEKCSYFHGDKSIKEIIEYDTIKYELCRLHGIKIFYYANDDKDDYIDTMYTDAVEMLEAIKIYNNQKNS